MAERLKMSLWPMVCGKPTDLKPSPLAPLRWGFFMPVGFARAPLRWGFFVPVAQASVLA